MGRESGIGRERDRKREREREEGGGGGGGVGVFVCAWVRVFRRQAFVNYSDRVK